MGPRPPLQLCPSWATLGEPPAQLHAPAWPWSPMIQIPTHELTASLGLGLASWLWTCSVITSPDSSTVLQADFLTSWLILGPASSPWYWFRLCWTCLLFPGQFYFPNCVLWARPWTKMPWNFLFGQGSTPLREQSTDRLCQEDLHIAIWHIFWTLVQSPILYAVEFCFIMISFWNVQNMSK